MKRFSISIVCTLLVGCALPVSDRVSQEFIPDDEIQAVNLVREGIDYYQSNRYMEAEFSLRRALKLFPTADNIKINLALALKKQEQFEEALQIFNEALKSDPDSIEILLGIGGVYFESEQYPKAIELYTKAYELALEEGDAERAWAIRRNLAVLSFLLGDLEGALCFSEEAFSWKPNMIEAEKHVRILAAVGHYQEAVTLLGNVMNPEYPEPEGLGLRAQLELALGNYSEALKYAVQAAVGTQVNSELTLVKQVAIELGGELTSAEPTEEPEEEDELKIEDLFNGEPLESELALYWPYLLIKYLSSRPVDTLES